MSELREALEEAYDAVEEPEHTEQPREETGRQEQVAEEPVRATAEEPTEKAVARDGSGRFARKPEEQPKETQPKVEQPEEQPKAEQSFKAPASWKPTARENWSQIPADVQQEIVRREHEAQQVLQQTAEARQVSSALQNLSQKYNAALSAEGVDILTATDNLAQIATKLRFGQTGEKAELIARLIQVYGVDITTLDNVLAGLPPQPAAMQQTFHDPRLDQLLAQQQLVQQQKRAQAQQEATAEVDSFASGREFFSDVREMMADIIEVAARRNLDLTLEQAYDQAIKLHPEVSKIVAQRAQASAAQSPTRPTARSKQAASSVKSSPVGGTGQQESGSLREDILSAMESANGR